MRGARGFEAGAEGVEEGFGGGGAGGEGEGAHAGEVKAVKLVGGGDEGGGATGGLGDLGQALGVG